MEDRQEDTVKDDERYGLVHQQGRLLPLIIYAKRLNTLGEVLGQQGSV